MSREHVDWQYPTHVRFGCGRIAELADACRSAEIRNPLIVTDSGLADHRLINRAIEALHRDGLSHHLFSDVRPNPDSSNVEDGVTVYRHGKHDGVVAFGGGSPIDAAKAIALMVGQTRPLWDFEDVGDNFMRADAKAIAPIVAVPTTAGTGSEVGRVAVIHDPEQQTKRLIFHPRLLPREVICDPELTYDLPADLTAATGVDALSHNLEAFCSPQFHPMCDGIALEGMRLIYQSIDTAVKNGRDANARSAMLAASTMGATAFQKGLGAMHSLAHAIGARYNTHHGRTIAAVMPTVLQSNQSHVEQRMAMAAGYMGVNPPTFSGFLSWLGELMERLSLPKTLGDLGVSASDDPDLAMLALRDPSTKTNPRVLSQADFAEMIASLI